MVRPVVAVDVSAVVLEVVALTLALTYAFAGSVVG